MSKKINKIQQHKVVKESRSIQLVAYAGTNIETKEDGHG